MPRGSGSRGSIKKLVRDAQRHDRWHGRRRSVRACRRAARRRPGRRRPPSDCRSAPAARRARRATGSRAIVRGRSCCRRGRYVPPSRSRKFLGSGMRREALTAIGRRTRSEIERVAFALVLAAQIVDQAGEEDPEDIQHDLGDVDVAGDCAGLHAYLPQVGLAGKFGQAEPRRWRLAGSLATGARAGRWRPGWRTAARSRCGRRRRSRSRRRSAPAPSAPCAASRRRRRAWRRRARWRSRRPSPAPRPRRRAPVRSGRRAPAPWRRSACRPRTGRRRSRSGRCRAGTAAATPEGAAKITAEKATSPARAPKRREPVGIGAAAQRACGEREAGQRAAGQQRRERGRRADRRGCRISPP